MPLRHDWEGCMVSWLRPNNWVSFTHGESAFYLGTSDPCLTRGASLRSMRPTHHLDTGSEMVNPAPVMTLATGIRSMNLSCPPEVLHKLRWVLLLLPGHRPAQLSWEKSQGKQVPEARLSRPDHQGRKFMYLAKCLVI